ncbi:GCN5 family acetyltransferase [Haloprofundus marisrubri]|uniref:GCN5 family acetyltransferase n=1 Tax=Haloprofundus marisrubri TaxID=1514971 RepID=A0A0W1R508_9EURY|nr:GNAT family protein [Haloprofundus marisrubri]KTG08467.1 GCN5 family acetyltransferase [Haloprofundus marisrubri]
MFPETVETERLRLERLGPDSVGVHEFYEVMSSVEMDEVTRHHTQTRHETPKESADYLSEKAEQWRNGDAAQYVVRPREGEDGAGEFAGVTGLQFQWDRRTAIMGLWLRPQFWGRGYSGERAAALLHVAFEQLDLELASPAHTPENEQSKRAIEKYVERFGGRYEGVLRNWVPAEMTTTGEVWDLHRYTISQEEWRAAVDDESVETPEVRVGDA